MRLHRPIGIWLLYFPAAWAVALAAPKADLGYNLLLMLLGATVTRAAGCIINDLTDRKLDADLARACAQIRDCNTYADIAEWECRRTTPEMWDARKVVRRVLNGGTLIRHELDLRISWSGEPCRRIGDAEEATSKIEAQIAARPPFIRQWETERDLLRSLAADVDAGRIGRLTVAQIEEHEERRAKERRMFG